MTQGVKRQEIRFCGAGGQGIITAAIILAEAAGVYDGWYVCQTQSYGPEARGGTCKAEVIISATEIDYPKASNPDLLLAMNQSSCDAYFADLKPSGLLVVDATLVKKLPTARVVTIPFTKMARQDLGNEVVATIIALGAVGYLCGSVSLENLEKALLSRVPQGTEGINLQALRLGIDTARHYDILSLPKTSREEEE